ncbi:hypothetical protein Tco_0817472, partial [Tanacetum coccineum]
MGVLSAAKVLADAAKTNVHTYTKRRRAVSTGSGGISNVGTLMPASTGSGGISIGSASMPVCTAGMVVNISIPSPVVVKDKGKGKMEESEDEQIKRTKLQQEQYRLGHEVAVRLQEELDEEERQRMARVHEAAQSFTKEEWENIRARVEADEELSKRLQAEERNKYNKVDQAKMLVDLINQRKKYFATHKAEAKRNKSMTQTQQRNYMINYIKHMGSHVLQQLKRYSFDELNELFETTMKNVNTFVPIETKDKGRASELATGSSQATIIDSAEVGSSKRAAEAELDHEGSKRKKTNEASGSVQEQPEEEEKELSNIQSLTGRFTLKNLENIGRSSGSSSTEPTDDKERTLWVELKRLFEPNTNDTQWKLQRYMHDPLKWRLYDTCGVHHVSTERGIDIFMLDVTENGNSFKPAAKTTTNADGTSTTLIPGPVTTKEKYKDAKTLFVAIQTRFGESLDSIFNRLQKIVSQLDILGENISQEDLNLKFLRSLPSEWNIDVVVWRNKPDLDIISFDDLYNNFKIVEQEVKGSASSSSSLNSLNMAFVSSSSSTNDVNTTYRVSTANLSDDTVYAFLASQPNGSQLVYEDLEQIHEDDNEEMDLKWQLALLSMRTRRFFQKTDRKITINRSDTAGYDKSKVECFNCHKMRHFARESRDLGTKIAGTRIKTALEGLYMADDEVPTNMALMAFLDSEIRNDKTCSKTCLKSFKTFKTQLDDLRIEFNKADFNLENYKGGLTYVEEQLVFYKKNEVIFCEQLTVLKRDNSYKDSKISMLKSELEKLKQEKESNQLKIKKFDNASNSLDKLIGSQILDKSRKGLGFVSNNAIPPPPRGLFSPQNLDLSNSGLEEFQQPEFEGYRPKTSKNVSEDTLNEVRESPDARMVDKLVSDDKL